MKKNIVFDFGNVLFKWDEAEMAKKYSNNKEEQEIIKKVILKSKEWFMLDDGSLNYQEAISIFKRNLPENLKSKAEEVMNTWYKKMPINQEICSLIKELKEKNYRIYALSNTHVSVYDYVKSLEIGKYFDGFLISAVEKMMKPNEEIYYRLFEKFNLVPEECFFIDDNEKNIAIAKKCGMEGHIFDINDFQKLVKELKEKDILI